MVDHKLMWFCPRDCPYAPLWSLNLLPSASDCVNMQNNFLTLQYLMQGIVGIAVALSFFLNVSDIWIWNHRLSPHPHPMVDSRKFYLLELEVLPLDRSLLQRHWLLIILLSRYLMTLYWIIIIIFFCGMSDIGNNFCFLQIRFIDNTDPAGIDHQIAQLGPELASTLVIVISKVRQGIILFVLSCFSFHKSV